METSWVCKATLEFDYRYGPGCVGVVLGMGLGWGCVGVWVWVGFGFGLDLGWVWVGFGFRLGWGCPEKI